MRHRDVPPNGAAFEEAKQFVRWGEAQPCPTVVGRAGDGFFDGPTRLGRRLGRWRRDAALATAPGAEMRWQDQDFEAIEQELQPFFFEAAAECPYGFPTTAVYRQAMLGRLPATLYGRFLAHGYRRNGNWLYRMACPQCDRCVSIRLRPAEFRPDRNQRRVWRRNRDLSVAVAPLAVDEEKIALCDRFLQGRYPGRGASAREYYAGFFMNTMTTTLEVCYRLGERLVGVGIIDVGDDWMNAVYHYFDPDFGRRSPGTNNILQLIELCRLRGIEYLYLGFVIHGVSAMAYKVRFRPHYLLTAGNWQRSAEDVP